MNDFSRPKVTVNSGRRIGTPGSMATRRYDQRARWQGFQAWESTPLTGAERLEGDDGGGVLNAGNDLHLFVDEMADIGVVVDVEFHQQIVIARGGINFGGDLGLGKRVGDGIGLAELAFELDEKGNHRCRLRKVGAQYNARELAGNNTAR